MLYRLLLARARRAGPQAELDARRRLSTLATCSHAALAGALLTGAASMRARGWSFSHPGWLGVKLLLTLGVVAPLEALHAWTLQTWMRRGLRDTQAPPFSQGLRRAVAIEEMLGMLALPLLGLALPLILWLSLSRPF